MIENREDIVMYLQQDIGIRESKQYPDISRMDMSEEEMSQYSHVIHRLKDKQGADFALQKTLDVYRVNPLLGVKVMETSFMNGGAEDIVYGLKVLYTAVVQHNDVNNGGHMVILNGMVPYTILLIEAAYQNSVCDIWDTKDVFLSYAKDEDYASHQRGDKPRFLNRYNIRHILKHIPDNRQIEFINWFWDKHCYAVHNYGKIETYAGRRVEIMMSELRDSCLWKHLENKDSLETSDRNQEYEWKVRERWEICRFIDNTIQEGRHVQYIEIILGEENFYDKLRVLMGDECIERYNSALETSLKLQKKLENERIQAQMKRRRMNQYYALTDRVRQKYLSVNDPDGALQWHYIGVNKKDHLSLWNYWQGYGFEDVRIMVLDLDWGSVNDESEEMEKCLRRIQMLKNNEKNKPKYYSCEYKMTDNSLEWLFRKCFKRNVKKVRYKDLYFSTLCLGYRKQPDTEISDDLVRSDIEDFLLDELKIIQPDVVFCLGSKVHRLFMEGVGVSVPDEEAYEEAKDGMPCSIVVEDNTIQVYALPHCGEDGMKKIPLEKQLKVWNLVRKNMEENGIRM